MQSRSTGERLYSNKSENPPAIQHLIPYEADIFRFYTQAKFSCVCGYFVSNNRTTLSLFTEKAKVKPQICEDPALRSGDPGIKKVEWSVFDFACDRECYCDSFAMAAVPEPATR